MHSVNMRDQCAAIDCYSLIGCHYEMGEGGAQLLNGIGKIMDRRKPGLLATINVVN